MTLKLTNMLLSSIMSSSAIMVEGSSVFFQYVHERAAHVKTDRVSRRCRPVP